MKRIAVLADVHGNVVALRAVLGDALALGVERVVSLGDVLSGPFPRETLDLLLSIDVPVVAVRGNADREVLAGDRAHGQDWVRAQLTPAQRAVVTAWPLTARVEVEGLGAVRCCHATPRDDEEIVLATTGDERVRSVLAAVEERVVVCGHTHMPFDRRVDGWRLVNPGSVGMPYGAPGAHWALLGPDVELRRTHYDRVAAADEIRRHSNWPGANAFADENVIVPPSTAEALVAFQPLESRRRRRVIAPHDVPRGSPDATRRDDGTSTAAATEPPEPPL